MYRAFYEASRFPEAPLFSALLFFVLFAGVVAWVLSARRETFDGVERLPLADDASSTPHRPRGRIEVKP